jgi:hypothetical protein
MDETRIRERLDDLARGAGAPDLSELGRRTIGRARRRRALNAVASVLVNAGLATGGYVGARSLLETPAPRILTPDPSVTPDGGGSPSFQGFPGLWPETDADTLAEAQAAADNGHQPMRTSPDGTAILAAVNLLGWSDSDVQIERSSLAAGTAIVVISNRGFGDGVPPITLTLQQLGTEGESGVWSVIAMSTPLINVAVGGDPTRPTLRIFGEVTILYEGATTLQIAMLDGPGLGDALGQIAVEGTGNGGFELEVEPEPTPDGRAVLLVSLPDATGRSLGAVMMLVPTPVGDPSDELDVTGLPPDVAATAQRIYDAIPPRDFDALAELLDPMTFVFNFDDGSDPIPAWRDDPSVLDLALSILELPAAAPREIEGYGTFHIWPYLIDSDFSALTDQEIADLHSLGYDDRDIELMVQGGNGYQGPRLAIDATGLWRNFITGGD